MSSSFIVGSCLCSNQGSIADLLRCAPCPPPTIPFEEFRDHALNRSLLLKEACIIARRCDLNGTDFDDNCPPVISDCPQSTTIHTYVEGNQSDSVVWIAWIVLITVLIIAVLILIICVRKRKRKKGKYHISDIKKLYRNWKTIKGKSSDQKTIQETTFIFDKENVVEKTVYKHTRESTTDAEETRALTHTVTEDTLEYYSAPESNEEIIETDIDIHGAIGYDKGAKPVPLAITFEEDIILISKEISEQSSPDQFELPEPAGISLREHLEPVPQDNSDTCPHKHLTTSVHIHPEARFEDPDNNSIKDVDSLSFHSADSFSDMDK